MRRGLPSCLLLVAAWACSFPEYEVSGLSSSCSNGVRDAQESGVDCGPGCEPCTPCTNAVQDSDEQGVDCGGSCAACARCDDQQLNGSESDVDCGGACANRCETDQRCLSAADCSSLVCASVCQPATCTDGVRNGDESGTDCGGEACPNCMNGQPCRADTDCELGLCQQELCVSQDCSNGDLDNEETDVDCGGPACAPCSVDSRCLIARDCASNSCNGSGVCSAATCSDLKLNQGESSVDCGGPVCSPCGDGEICAEPADCASALCQNGRCVSTCAAYALEFDGASSVKVARPVQDDFTIEAWIKTNATAKDGPHYWNGVGLFWADVVGGGDDFGAAMLGSHIAFGAGKANGGEVNLVGGIAVNTGSWTHVAVTRQKSSGQLQIIINGKLDRTLTDASQTSSLNDSTYLELGGNSEEAHYYQGLMDEVRVWDFVRTSDDLDADKNRRLAGNEPGLVAYWRFDEGVSLVTVDSSSEKNDGILQGPPNWVLSEAPICPQF